MTNRETVIIRYSQLVRKFSSFQLQSNWLSKSDVNEFEELVKSTIEDLKNDLANKGIQGKNRARSFILDYLMDRDYLNMFIDDHIKFINANYHGEDDPRYYIANDINVLFNGLIIDTLQLFIDHYPEYINKKEFRGLIIDFKVWKFLDEAHYIKSLSNKKIRYHLEEMFASFPEKLDDLIQVLEEEEYIKFNIDGKIVWRGNPDDKGNAKGMDLVALASICNSKFFPFDYKGTDLHKAFTQYFNFNIESRNFQNSVIKKQFSRIDELQTKLEFHKNLFKN